MSKQVALRSRVYSYYEKHKNKGKMFTFEHFMSEGVAKSTVSSIIKRCESGITIERIKGSGRIAKKMPKAKVKQLKAMFDHKDGRSQPMIAKKFNISQQYVSKLLKTKTTIVCRKKIKIPNRTDQHASNARYNCSTLLRKYKNFEWIIDDESYFTLKHSTINGNGNFYTSDIKLTPPSVKYSKKDKYEKKLLVWVAFSKAGLSKFFIVPSGLAIDGEMYKKQCIEKRLHSFIKDHHSGDNYVFWPDKASSHYSNIVIDYFLENSINFVDYKDNPTNLPECRPIEDFWSLIKGEVYKNGWEAKDLKQLENKIKYCLKNFDNARIRDLILTIPRRLDYVRRHGVIERR